MVDYFLSVTYPKYKLAIVVLITLNVVIYAIVDTLINSADTLAWLVLLILYELEANDAVPLAKNMLTGIRNVLIAVIGLVFVSYVYNSEWLDVVNSAFWFALIALLELEVRWPDQVIKCRKSYWLATIIVFAGLVSVVIAWAWKSAWLDVYDAALWIIAFASIEMDFFQFLKHEHA